MAITISHHNPVPTLPASHTCNMSHPHIIFLVLVTQIIYGQQYKSWSSVLCSLLHYPITLSLLGPHILKTLSSLNARDRYKTCKNTVLYTLLITFFDYWKTKCSAPNDSKHSLTSTKSYLHDWNFWLVVPFPNVWTVPPFQIIYYLSLCCVFSCMLFLRYDHTQLFAAFICRPVYLLAITTASVVFFTVCMLPCLRM
jgi:hypothetical protein